MLKEKSEAEKILSQYGQRMFDSHVRYFSDADNANKEYTYTPMRVTSMRRSAKCALILCATLILAMSLAVVVCSALGLQIFNYKFDFQDGFIIITNLNEEPGINYYKPEYIVKDYHLKEIVPLGESSRYYVYVSNTGEQEYIIEESTSKDAIVYIDSEGYDVQNEIYGGHDLIIYCDQTSQKTITYLEKDGTFIAISGMLSVDEIHCIIDSLTLDTEYY